MKRKDFIKTVAPLAAAPLIMKGFRVSAMGQNSLIKALGARGDISDRVLVLIQLNGGNDGLNTVIPVDQYSKLSGARGNILIPENKALALSGVSNLNLHPAMTGLRSMFDNGNVTVVQDVGYPNPNYSHFRSTDIWLSGSDSNEYLNSGWIGRYLSDKYPGFPEDYPNVDMPDPLGIQVGSVVSPVYQGHEVGMAMAISDPTSYYQMLTGTTDPAPNTPAGHELTYIRLVASQTNKYTTTIKAAAEKVTNLSTKYPSGGRNSLAEQLKIVAQLIAGGLRTKVYMVQMGGFDTHAAQTDATDTTVGTHASLLGQMSEAIDAFQDDLKLLQVQDKVLGMSFSEFGRRIVSNFSLGTDHGAAAPLFFFGSSVQGGVIGSSSNIPDNPGVNDNIPMQYDYRSVYATVLREWFGLTDAQVKDVLLDEFASLPAISGSSSLGEAGGVLSGNVLGLPYPNPMQNRTMIDIESDGGYMRLSVFDRTGREVQVLAEGAKPKGKVQVTWDGSHQRAGVYYLRLQTAKGQSSRQVVKL